MVAKICLVTRMLPNICKSMGRPPLFGYQHCLKYLLCDGSKKVKTDQSERHYSVLVVTWRANKGSFPFISLTYSDKIVCAFINQVCRKSWLQANCSMLGPEEGDTGTWLRDCWAYSCLCWVSSLLLKKRLKAEEDVEGRMNPCWGV